MIISFEDYVPEPRYDGTAWTQITIEESATENGPWTLIDTQALNPLDADPKSPAARSFTTTHGTLAAGWYRVSFKDAGGNIILTDPVQNIELSDIDYKPTIGQVARKNLSRTRDKFGKDGAFSTTTKPTDMQVIQIIDDVATEVADVIGDTVPDALVDDASNVLAIRAAMQIELDYFADQVNTGRSIYPQLEAQYTKSLAALQKQITLIGEGEAAVSDAGASASPSYSFPDASSWMTRRM